MSQGATIASTHCDLAPHILPQAMNRQLGWRKKAPLTCSECYDNIMFYESRIRYRPQVIRCAAQASGGAFRSDMKTGRITREKALEVVEPLFLKIHEVVSRQVLIK